MEEIKLSPRLLKSVKRVKEGEIRIFRLLKSTEKDPATGKPVRPAGFRTTGEFFIYDKFEDNPAHAKKVIKNITSTQMVLKDGDYKSVEIVEDIDFDRSGTCIVKHTEHNKLVCLTLANENNTNKFRDKSVRAIWEEIMPEKNIAVQTEELNYIFHAGTMIKEATAKNKLREMAIGAGVQNVDNKTSEQVMHDLLLKAKNSPKDILRSGSDLKIKYGIYITDAMALGLIDFWEEDREWKYAEVDTVICKVGESKDEKESLAEYLANNHKSGKELIEAVDRIYRQAA